MLHRRDAMLRLGQLGGAVALPGLLQARSAAPRSGSADSCIYLFLWGGPPQQDTFDLKPDAPAEIRGEFRPIRTNVPGIDICDQLPRLARLADKYALVRSLTHRSDNHEPSVYHMMTGRVPPRQFSVPNNQRTRADFPNIASVVSHFTPPTGVPASVTVPRPIGHDGSTYAGTYAGWLGPRHDPFERAPAKETREVATHALDPQPDLPDTRIAARSSLLTRLQHQDAALQRGSTAIDENHDRALRMLATPAVRQAFELGREPTRTRDRYGRNEYGESLLLSRRLVEAGVGLVTISWMYIFPDGNVANVWDNHSGAGVLGAKTGYDLLRGPTCLPALDRGLSALIEDLAERGLLERTLIAAAGEFGRTPKVNKDGGRDHWGACQSALFAGGGVRGGQVIGRSDRNAAYPADRPVSPADFLATLYSALGIDPHAELRDREHRPYTLVDGDPIAGLMG
ncbi:MAG TPA: DUF1501 domain-containing protein [Urbifossiella sp.]|nr:DUF1501 domain-containing protein [Urbifossiella sp.]